MSNSKLDLSEWDNATCTGVLFGLLVNFYFVLFSGPLDSVPSLAVLCLQQPFVMTLLAMALWIFWVPPASRMRRSFLLLFLIAFSWVWGYDITHFPISLLAYGYFSLVYIVTSHLIGLRGWDVILQLADVPARPRRFSIQTLLFLTSVVAVLCVASAAIVANHFRFAEFFILAGGFAAGAALLHHAFTVNNGNLAWLRVAVFVLVALLPTVGCLRYFDPSFSDYGGNTFGHGGLLYCRYWIDIFASLFLFSLLIIPLSIRAGWSAIEQKRAACRQELEAFYATLTTESRTSPSP